MSELSDIAVQVRANLDAALLLSQQSAAVIAELDALTGVGQSKNRYAEVSVNRYGFVTNLRLAPDATAESTKDLGADVMEAKAAAMEDLQEQARPIQAKLTVDPQTLIDQEELTERLESIARKVLGTPPEERATRPTEGERS